MNAADAEIEAWAQKKYPQFIANKTLIKRLFLIEKGVRFSAPFQPKELRSINQLVVGETADIQAVVVQELSTRSYIGCPNDSKKIPDAIEGKEAVCPKCGNIVKPKILQWALFLVGDATDEIIASFPPSIMNRPTEGMIIVAQGLLGENEEFLVYRWSLPADTKAGASTEAPLQSFFKPSAAPPTTSPATAPPITSTPTTAAPVSAPQATTTAPPTAPSTALMCDQCSAGPFPNALVLAGHKANVHVPKKASKRMKKPGVGAYSPVSSPASSVSSPGSSGAVPGSSGAVPGSSGAVPASPGAVAIITAQPSQPTSTAPTEPDSRPITLTASPEQAVLTTATTEQIEKTTEQIEKTTEQIEKKPEQPVQGPSDSLLSTAQVQAPNATAPATTATTTAPKEAVKEEIKAVEGASEGSIKFAKVCGLIAKPLPEFKLHFEANFPKDDMLKAIEAAHCAVVDNKVVFIGG
jgi:hypothetical protein